MKMLNSITHSDRFYGLDKQKVFDKGNQKRLDEVATDKLLLPSIIYNFFEISKKELQEL